MTFSSRQHTLTGAQPRTTPVCRCPMPLSSCARQQRAAVSLVEMLVVLIIFAILFGIIASLLPRIQEGAKVQQAASTLQSMLLSARQLAVRDRRPTGVRLVPSAANPLFVDRLQYVQKPDDVTGGTATPNSPACTLPAGVISAIQIGDYLELSGGGLLYRITSINTATNMCYCGDLGSNASVTPPAAPPAPQNATIIDTTKAWVVDQWKGWTLKITSGASGTGAGSTCIILSNTATGLTFSPDPLYPITTSGSVAYQIGDLPGNATPNYRIICQPRPMLGQPTVSLPLEAAIDINNPYITGSTYQASGSIFLNATGIGPLPMNPSTGHIDILFSPTGAVVGRGTTGDRLALWVRDTSYFDHREGGVSLVVVNLRTGLIGVVSLDTVSGDPYGHAKAAVLPGM